MVRTLASHAGNRGSNPLRNTKSEIIKEELKQENLIKDKDSKIKEQPTSDNEAITGAINRAKEAIKVANAEEMAIKILTVLLYILHNLA